MDTIAIVLLIVAVMYFIVWAFTCGQQVTYYKVEHHHPRPRVKRTRRGNRDHGRTIRY